MLSVRYAVIPRVPFKNFIIKKVFPLSMAEGTKVREGANYSLITIENAFINQNRSEGVPRRLKKAP